MMAQTTPRYIKCGWRFVVCRVTTLISCFRRDARVATDGAVGAHVTAPPPQKPSATLSSYPCIPSPIDASPATTKTKQPVGWVERHQIDVHVSMGFAKSSTHPTYYRCAQDI